MAMSLRGWGTTSGSSASTPTLALLFGASYITLTGIYLIWALLRYRNDQQRV